MNKILLASLVLLALCGGMAPAHADSFSFSYSSYDGGGRWGPPGRSWHRGPWHRPPHTVVYAPSPPVYVVPPVQPVVYETRIVPSSVIANQTSPTFIDSAGRECRAYQTTAILYGRARTVSGTACLYTDGAWRSVD